MRTLNGGSRFENEFPVGSWVNPQSLSDFCSCCILVWIPYSPCYSHETNPYKKARYDSNRATMCSKRKLGSSNGIATTPTFLDQHYSLSHNQKRPTAGGTNKCSPDARGEPTNESSSSQSTSTKCAGYNGSCSRSRSAAACRSSRLVSSRDAIRFCIRGSS
jgi:hypothetical protein